MSGSVQFVGCQPGQLVVGGQKYRATWSAGSVAQYVWRGSLILENLEGIYNGKLDATGLMYAVSRPAVAPGATTGTMDVKVTGRAQSLGASVAGLAAILDMLATSGINLDLVRLELVGAGESSVQAAVARDGAADAAAEQLEESSPFSLAKMIGGRMLMFGAVALVVYLLFISGGLRATVTKSLRRGR